MACGRSPWATGAMLVLLSPMAVLTTSRAGTVDPPFLAFLLGSSVGLYVVAAGIAAVSRWGVPARGRRMRLRADPVGFVLAVALTYLSIAASGLVHGLRPIACLFLLICLCGLDGREVAAQKVASAPVLVLGVLGWLAWHLSEKDLVGATGGSWGLFAASALGSLWMTCLQLAVLWQLEAWFAGGRGRYGGGPPSRRSGDRPCRAVAQGLPGAVTALAVLALVVRPSEAWSRPVPGSGRVQIGLMLVVLPMLA